MRPKISQHTMWDTFLFPIDTNSVNLHHNKMKIFAVLALVAELVSASIDVDIDVDDGTVSQKVRFIWSLDEKVQHDFRES